MHQGAKTMLMAQYSCRVKFATLSWKTVLMKFAYTSFIYTYNIHVCVVTCVYVVITHIYICIYIYQDGKKPLIIVDALRPLNEGVHNIAQMVEFVNICQPTNPSQSGLLHPGTGESKASTSSSSMSVLLITEDHFGSLYPTEDLQIDRWKRFAIVWHEWQPSAFQNLSCVFKHKHRIDFHWFTECRTEEKHLYDHLEN